MSVKFNSRYVRSPVKGVVPVGKSRTRQEFVAECDINVMLARYLRQGGLPPAVVPLRYADVSELPDYQGALDVVSRAEEAFDSLSSEVRRRFDNDPSKLMIFLADPKNRPEAIRLGLIEKPVKPAPDKFDKLLDKLDKLGDTVVDDVKKTKGGSKP